MPAKQGFQIHEQFARIANEFETASTWAEEILRSRDFKYMSNSPELRMNLKQRVRGQKKSCEAGISNT